jgi:hypothetical protein
MIVSTPIAAGVSAALAVVVTYLWMKLRASSELLELEAISDCFQRTRRPTWEQDLELILSAQGALERLYTELDARDDRSAAEPVLKKCDAAYDALEYLGGVAAGLDREHDWPSASVPAHVRLRPRRSLFHKLTQRGDAR